MYMMTYIVPIYVYNIYIYIYACISAIHACMSAYVCSISLSLSIMTSMAIDGSSSPEMQVP